MRTKLFILPVFIFVCRFLYAQDTSYLIITNNDKELVLKDTPLPSFFLFSAERENYLNAVLFNLYSKGYLSAQYKIIRNANDTLTVTFQKFNKIYWAQLNVDSVDDIFLNGAGYNKKDFYGKIYRQQEVFNLYENILEFAENHGYPFASISLEQVRITDSILSASLQFKKSRLLFFDSLKIMGNIKLSNNFLQQYTGIKQGDIYDESLIKNLDERLKELPFASVTNYARVEFSGDKAKPVVYLDEKNASRFDFLIGVLPNNAITGRLIVTGEGTLLLHNIFGEGELLNVQFSKLESTSKQLQTNFTYPYLPKIPLGVDGSFSLYLKDSTFLERKSSAGILYQLIGNNYVKVFTSWYNSSVLQIDTSYILAVKKLPASLDVSIISYGLSFQYEKLNYIFNPRSGFLLSATGAAGTKTIKQNNTILSLTDPVNPEFDFATLYDSVQLKSLSINYSYRAQYFIPVFKSSTILLAVTGASLINDQIFENELFRIGGAKLLRGFDEQSVTVSGYHIGTFEYRYLLSKNSFAGLFFDGAYTLDKSKQPVEKDFPFGFGADINFETKAGIFGLTYAVGSTQGNPILLRTAKIHFGYVNYF